MTRRSPLVRWLPVAAVVLFVAVAAAQTQPQEPPRGFADPVLGAWDLTVHAPAGAYPSWLDVRLRKETELMGRFVGQFGSVRYLTRLDFRDGKIEFGVPVQYERQKTDLSFTGSLVGDRLEGTTQAPDGSTLKWTGVRAPLLLREGSPKWGTPVPLFNGRDLDGWVHRGKNSPTCWSVEAGVLTNKPPKCADLISTRTFNDFRLQAEFRYPPKSNSGIYLRGRYEVQIQDDAGRAVDPLRMGAIYGFLRPLANAAAAPGEWQTFDITLIGRRVTVVLNGRTVVDNSIIDGITGGALDSDEGAPGPIMLQGDHEKIEFRRIELTPAL